MQRSTSCCIWWCQKDRIITIQQLTLVLGRRAKRGRSLSSLSATSNCEPHDFIRLRASATVGLESREADGCPSFLEKRDRRELSFLIESGSQCMQTAPSRTSRACSMPKQKTQQSCVSSGVKQRGHGSTHFLNALLVLAIVELENCTLTRFTLHASNKPVSEDEKADDVFSRRHLYCGTPVVTSWAVAGQQVVFFHMYLQTESRWGRSP